jgi:hypothetical protein
LVAESLLAMPRESRKGDCAVSIEPKTNVYDRLVTALHCLMDRPEFATLAKCRIFAKNCANGYAQGSPALLVGTSAHFLAVAIWCSNAWR